MSLDYPFYEELRRRQHPASKWWRIGDILYYVGLLPAVTLAFPTLWSLFKLPSGVSRWQLWILSLFIVFGAIFVLGTQFKLKAWRMAAKDGINVNDY